MPWCRAQSGHRLTCIKAAAIAVCMEAMLRKVMHLRHAPLVVGSIRGRHPPR
jgi:hypothetical protein